MQDKRGSSIIEIVLYLSLLNLVVLSFLTLFKEQEINHKKRIIQIEKK